MRTVSGSAFYSEIQSRMTHSARRILVCLLLGMMALFTLGFTPPTLVDREIAPTQRRTLGQLRQQAQFQQTPAVASRAYLVYDVQADATLMAINPDQPLAQASLTKLMTALLVLEREAAEPGFLQSTVRIQPSDLVGGATMGLVSGESLTVEDLLWGILLPSGNDAATALARVTAGSVEGFVNAMNRRAAELGLAETQFANPEGLDAPGHHTSAKDLLTLTQADWAFPLFQRIVGTASVSVAGHALQSTNEMLGSYAGVNGVKTGTTDVAGQCLVVSVEQDGHQRLAVILGSNARYADARTLLDQADLFFSRNPGPGERLTALERMVGTEGKVWLLRPLGDAPDLLLPRWQRQDLQLYRRLDLPPLIESWQPGLTAGVLEWRLGGEVVGTQVLVLE